MAFDPAEAIWIARSRWRGSDRRLTHVRQAWPDGWPKDRALCGAMPASGWAQASGEDEPSCGRCREALGLPAGDPR